MLSRTSSIQPCPFLSSKCRIISNPNHTFITLLILELAVQELCGAMTALAYAKRDVLGERSLPWCEDKMS
jgi:hypothetical protein